MEKLLGCNISKMFIEKTVALYNLTSNASKEEHTTVPKNLKDVMVTFKPFF